MVPVLNCTEVIPGVAFSAAIGVQLNKNGSGTGSVVFTTDTTGPNYTCDDGTVTTGPLTMTPLAQNHDQDGDGCTDWDELDPTSTGSDPFDPSDCSAGNPPTSTPVPVGGVAELSQVAGAPVEAGASDSRDAPILTRVVGGIVAAGTATLGGVAWYIRRRRLL